MPAINCSPEVQISQDKGVDAIQSGTPAPLAPEEQCWGPHQGCVSSGGPAQERCGAVGMSLVEATSCSQGSLCSGGVACPARVCGTGESLHPWSALEILFQYQTPVSGLHQDSRCCAGSGSSSAELKLKPGSSRDCAGWIKHIFQMLF